MGASVDYLQKDPKTGRLSYRRAYPPELRPYIPGKNGIGPRELKRSLKASTLTSGAWAKFRAGEAEFELIERRARQLASGSFHPIDGALIRFLADTFVAVELEHEERAGYALPDHPVEDRRTYVGRPDPEGDWEASRELLDDRDAAGLVAFWGDWVEGFARAHGYIVKPQGQPFADLCRGMAQAASRLWLELDRRQDNKGSETPPLPVPPRARSASQSKPAETFAAIVAKVMESKAHPVGTATQQATQTALRFFVEVLGDVPPGAVRKSDVTNLKELLAQRPAVLPKAHKALPLPKVVELYEGQDAVPRLAPKSLSQHLGMLSAAWGKAQDRGWIDPDLANPFKFKGIKASRRKNKVELTVDELNAIFRLPVFTHSERPTGCRGEAAYWVPLLLLWTGARPEEVAQLLVDDFQEDPKSKRWKLTFTNTGDHPHKGKRNLKTDDHGTGERIIPVPKKLIELGLITYVDAVRKSGSKALFPALRTRGERGLLFPSFGPWWGTYIRSNGIALEGRGRKPAREFRDVWTTAARASGIARDARQYIQGHSTTNLTANEDYGQHVPLGWQIDQWALEGLDLSAIRPWKAPGGA